MPWFQVDDTLATHPKAREAGLAAMGLWAVAGAYAAQHLTEGHVPDWYVNSWPAGRKLAARLVSARLWIVADDGWRFHQWEDRQRTKAEVEADRKANRDRQKKWREEQRRKAAEAAASNGETNDASNAESNAVTNGPLAMPSRLTTNNSTTSHRSPTVPAGAMARVIRAYVEACPEPPAEELQTKVERSARSLIGQGFTVDQLTTAAANAGRNGWTDLATQLQRDAARASPATNTNRSTTDERFHAGLTIANRLEAQENTPALEAR